MKDAVTNILTAAVLIAIAAPIIALLIALPIRIFRKVVAG